MRLVSYTLMLAGIWTVGIAVSLLWNLHQTSQNTILSELLTMDEVDYVSLIQARAAEKDGPGNRPGQNLVKGEIGGNVGVMAHLAPFAELTGRQRRLIWMGHGFVWLLGLLGLGLTFDRLKKGIAENKKLEAQLYQAQKMEAVGRLSGGIAHDFNNLLTSILGYSQMLLLEVDENHPFREKIGSIYAAGERAAGLTRQLLTFSRRQVLEMKVVDPNLIVEELTRMLQRLIGEDIELSIVCRPLHGNIVADAGQIEQILMNLAVNAKDAMPRGGRLTIETDAAILDEEYAGQHSGVTPGPYVVLTVTDSGEGMDREIQEQIFEPFFTTKEPGKGTGLGLATVYGIIQQHNGHVYVYSEPGRGTTFRLYFPKVDVRPDPVVDKARVSDIPRGNEVILVVDDDPAIRRLVFDCLQPLGYNVLVASGGREALEISDSFESTIHLLLTDVVMPGMNGRELAETLAHQRAGIGTIYMSGYTDDVVVHQGILNADTNFLPKPLMPSSLARKIRQVLDSES